ncbi:hypothetical protein GCM10011386_15980 [Parapedobacter defluvii]|uniref:Uncharacterized protein n=1 Tax=Parapedobacter defluvii TaxID=2045106 RepID=A0ABQ1LJS7_9SPHI|nr:hypothetical protein [Parapedobacter defluvii]GGC24816.1 hypothetical protein GCM10011386_15980 [Parapedobacter defluvii]
MKGFDEIQQLWQGQKPEPNVSFETILQHIKSHRTALTKKLFWQSVAVGTAVLTALWICIVVDFSTWTTYLALAIMVGCIGYYFANQLNDYKDISRNRHLLSKPQDYINYLRAFQQKRNRFNTRSYVVYEICIAVAFALYGIEMYFILPFWTLAGIFIFVVFWFLICHFVFMKQYIKHENMRIEEMIGNLERIKGQFRDR